MGSVSNIEIWWRKTSTKENASDLIILRFRADSRDYFLPWGVANYEPREKYIKEITDTVATAVQKHNEQGGNPLLRIKSTSFCHSDGAEYGRESWIIFYPNDRETPDDARHGLTWDKYPAIFTGGGATPENLLRPDDTLLASIPLNWPAEWELGRLVAKAGSSGP